MIIARSENDFIKWLSLVGKWQEIVNGYIFDGFLQNCNKILVKKQQKNSLVQHKIISLRKYDYKENNCFIIFYRDGLLWSLIQLLAEFWLENLTICLIYIIEKHWVKYIDKERDYVEKYLLYKLIAFFTSLARISVLIQRKFCFLSRWSTFIIHRRFSFVPIGHVCLWLCCPSG